MATDVDKAEVVRAIGAERERTLMLLRSLEPAQWDLDSELPGWRVRELVAHLEQAWYEATRTGDDDVRRTAKAPRRRLEQARSLLDKLQGCAQSNGASFSPASVWRRIEREVPQRQMDIALPN